MNGLIHCQEDCMYQKEGECSLDHVPKFCLELNARKACIYYFPAKPKKIPQEKIKLESYY